MKRFQNEVAKLWEAVTVDKGGVVVINGLPGAVLTLKEAEAGSLSAAEKSCRMRVDTM